MRNQSTSKRRWFRIGPGLVLALIASYFVWRQSPPQNTLPRVPSTSTAVPVNLSAPEPAWLLTQRDELKLSAPQLQKLNRLRTRWERDTRELRDAMNRASQQFDQEMKNRSARLSMQQLQQRAAPVSELSRRLALARRAWWDEAAKVLSDEQRRRAEVLWARRFVKDDAARRSPLPILGEGPGVRAEQGMP